MKKYRKLAWVVLGGVVIGTAVFLAWLSCLPVILGLNYTNICQP